MTGAPLRVFAVVLAWGAAACGPGFLLRAPDAPKDCGRIAVGPAVVSVFEFDPSGGLKPRSDWTYDAGQNVDAALAARVKHAGGRTFVAADVAHTDVTSDDFRHWGSKTLQEIAAAIAKSQPPAHQSVADWRFPESLTTWRAALGSDFALVLLFVDAYEPAALVGTGPSSSASSRYDPAQTGIACLVSFKDSRVVACGTSPRRFGDLRTTESARDAVDELVARICA